MNELTFSPEADEQLSALEANTGLSELYERVNASLDDLEDDPTSPDMRRLRYQTPPIWGVRVYGSQQDWLILWRETETGPHVHYVGPALK